MASERTYPVPRLRGALAAGRIARVPRAAGGGAAMTLTAMAASYHHSADLLRVRIVELREQAGYAGSTEKSILEQRIRELNILYRETRATAKALEHYYDRRECGHGAHTA